MAHSIVVAVGLDLAHQARWPLDSDPPLTRQAIASVLRACGSTSPEDVDRALEAARAELLRHAAGFGRREHLDAALARLEVGP